MPGTWARFKSLFGSPNGTSRREWLHEEERAREFRN